MQENLDALDGFENDCSYVTRALPASKDFPTFLLTVEGVEGC